MPSVSLALQGGGTHGAFTWGALDRLLEAVEAGLFEIAAISGASAGALNGAVAAAALAEGGPALARQRLGAFWRRVAERGALAGNALLGFGSPGPFGFNIDWSPAAIALEALGLVISPYTNPFYQDTLAPLLHETLPPERLAFLNGPEAPRLFVTAVDVGTDKRHNFKQPGLTIDTLRASACLPAEFKAVEIDGAYFWDGGYLGNPALDPLLRHADDLLLVLVNPLTRKDVPPKTARAILDRLNEISFNASVVLEMNSIAAINRLLRDVQDRGLAYDGPYRHINLHLIRDDAFEASLGVVSKSSTSWPFLQALHKAGYAAADRFLRVDGSKIGTRSSTDIKNTLVQPILNN